MNRNTHAILSFLVVALGVVGCASSDPESATVASLEAAPDGCLSLGPVTLAEFPQGFQVHGVAGDTALMFAVQPSDAPGIHPGVHVAHRTLGVVLPDVVAPPEGWATPLSVLVENYTRLPLAGSQGTLLVLDAGVTPANIGMAPARLYRYSYRYRPSSGLTTSLLETHLLPLGPSGIIYPGEPALLPGGRVAVPDTLVGSIWVSDSHLENWTMALVDPRLAANVAPPISGVGRDASGHISPYTYAAPPAVPGLPPGWGLYPGIHSIVYTDRTHEACFPVTASPGGIYCIALSSLLSTSIPPNAKSDAIRVLVPPTPGVSDLTDGVAYDRYAPTSPWLYWQRAPADTAGGGFNTLRRVHLVTGEIQVVASDNEIFSWANEIAILPPLIDGSPFTTVLSSVGQQYNNPEVNFAITTPSYFSPSPMPITVVRR